MTDIVQVALLVTVGRLTAVVAVIIGIATTKPLLAGAVLVSRVAPQKTPVSVVTLEGVSYKTSTGFNIAGIGVILILIALYATWW